jgi:23S rRNA (adenine2030-N6)-methyltransferase
MGMNYRHIYHAGNICDVVKHVTLLALLDALKRKPAPFMVLDTHAGCGLYDLHDEAVGKTGEAEAGVRAMLRAGGAGQTDYLAALAALNPNFSVAEPASLQCYPGSPSIILHALRTQDRYSGCELHPDDFALLRDNVQHRLTVLQFLAQLHQRDGYEAMLAFVPPPEKRGLVLIDPPYEQPDEFDRLAKSLQAAVRRWPAGIYAVWYPIKDHHAIAQFQARMAASGIRKQLVLEFIYQKPTALGLQGSGMLVINPPWQLAEMMAVAYKKLHQAWQNPVAETKIAWLVPE